MLRREDITGQPRLREETLRGLADADISVMLPVRRRTGTDTELKPQRRLRQRTERLKNIPFDKLTGHGCLRNCVS